MSEPPAGPAPAESGVIDQGFAAAGHLVDTWVKMLREHPETAPGVLWRTLRIRHPKQGERDMILAAALLRLARGTEEE